MPLNLFIAGTDTEIGKTYVSVGLLNALTKENFTVLGLKPVSAGCKIVDGKLLNDDGLRLIEASSVKLPYQKINPFVFAPAIAPNIAAWKANIDLSVATLQKKCSYAMEYPVDVRIIEGAGGWLLPLNNHETLADFVALMNLKVILVVGIRLGCLNHALLTYNAIKLSGLSLLGWVANCIDEHMDEKYDNVETYPLHISW